jgi:hypothetical protein
VIIPIFNPEKEGMMSENILLGHGPHITSISRAKWETHLSQVPQHAHERLGFMTHEHHQVRYFVVKELPRVGRPLEPKYIAQKLNLPLGQVNSILDDLEKHLTFLVRNQTGAVSWAYPVTVDPTPHKVTFKSGEQLYAA